MSSLYSAVMRQKIDDVRRIIEENPNSVNEVNKRLPNVVFQPKRMNNSSGGFSGISLTGERINPSNFVHNNMVPFFGGSIKQNTNEFITQTKLENFTF